MGVPTFYKWLSVKYPKVIRDAVESTSAAVNSTVSTEVINIDEVPPNGHFDALYLDMNGIIHPCCHPEEGAAPSSEDAMFSNIFDYIDRVVDVVQPKKLLYMAIDGVAPRAKMNQQRTRRFKAAVEAESEEKNYDELKDEFEKGGRSIPTRKPIWDSNVITPGTPFLYKLSEALHYYINDRMANIASWRERKVILSDANCPGEGEHKIMAFIRAQRTYPGYNPNLFHCLHGADADLIMLGLATHEPNFYILREAVLDAVNNRMCFVCGLPGHVAADCISEPDAVSTAFSQDLKRTWKPLQFLSIPVLREYLKIEFSFRDFPDFKPDFERCIDDFVLMCFFVGNDFLPHLPSLSIHKGSIDQFLLLYQKVRPIFPDYLTNSGTINLIELKKFVNYLGQVENSVFIEDLKRQQRIAQRQDNGNKQYSESQATGTTEMTTDDNFNALHLLKKSFSNTTDPVIFNQDIQPESKRPRLQEDVSTSISHKTHEEDIDEFKSRMRKKRKNENEIENPTDDICLGIGEKSDWRRRYYEKKFHLTSNEDLNVFVRRVASSYTEGLRWVLEYYYQGVPSWDWYYPFHYAPFASDISTFGTDNQVEFKLGQPFKPFDQLMAVLPSRSRHCLPKHFADLMTQSDSPILDFYPNKFKEDPDGKRYKWQWVVLLPFIDQQRLVTTLQQYESALTSDEKERNACGKDRLFVWKGHSLAQQIAFIQLGKTNENNHLIINEQSSDNLWGTISQLSTGCITGKNYPMKRCSSELFPSFISVCLSCSFECSPAHRHKCYFLNGVIIPDPILHAADMTEENSSRDRRFNAQAAKRMIINCLGRQGLATPADIEKYSWGSRPNGRNQYQQYKGASIHSDNKYQNEQFGNHYQTNKRARGNDYPLPYKQSNNYTSMASTRPYNNSVSNRSQPQQRNHQQYSYYSKHPSYHQSSPQQSNSDNQTYSSYSNTTSNTLPQNDSRSTPSFRKVRINQQNTHTGQSALPGGNDYTRRPPPPWSGVASSPSYTTDPYSSK